MQRVATGLDVLLGEQLSDLAGRKVGLITSRGAVTSRGVPASLALRRAGVDITALFSPEHGLHGKSADGVPVPDTVDEHTGIHLFSLYGPTRKPTSEMLDCVDVMLLDIQDVGARFYTFLSTMAYAMASCAERGKPFIVLDRPNPIGGLLIEGPVLDPRFSSFVGLYSMPIRYGLTIGETAKLLNSNFGIGADLRVIPMRGWQRNMWFDDTGLPWVSPSPAIPDLETALVYPGSCLFEGTNVSEGRGAPRPFLTLGAPWIEAGLLAEELNAAGLPGVSFDPVEFSPASSKYAGRACFGARIDVFDRDVFRPVLTGLASLEILLRTNTGEFRFREPGPDGRCFFDLLAGTDKVRLGLESGSSAEEIASSFSEALDRFQTVRRSCLLYD